MVGGPGCAWYFYTACQRSCSLTHQRSHFPWTNPQEQLKGKERRRPTAFASSGTPGAGGGSSSGSSYRSLSVSGAAGPGAKVSAGSIHITAAAAAAARAKAAARLGAGAGGGASLGPQRLPSSAARSGTDKDRAEEQRRKDLAVALGTQQQRPGSSPPLGGQTFTLDHFVQGVVEWDIFGELHAEANGNRCVVCCCCCCCC